MPKDSDIGRDLANQLTEAYGERIKVVEFTYDSYLKLDDLDEGRPYCKISPNNYEHIRESRNHWRESIQLTLTLVSKVAPMDEPLWIDGWLDSWDLIVREMRDMKVLRSKQRVLQVDSDERYDADLFHNHHRLVTQATVSFGNVEVI